MELVLHRQGKIANRRPGVGASDARPFLMFFPPRKKTPRMRVTENVSAEMHFSR